MEMDQENAGGCRTDLVDGKRLIVVNDTNFAGVGEFQHLGLLDVDDVPDGQGDLDAVAVVVGPEYDPLEALDPFLGAGGAICLEIVGPVVGH